MTIVDALAPSSEMIALIRKIETVLDSRNVMAPGFSCSPLEN